jgi:DNA-binding IclR family transcriptional regulator
VAEAAEELHVARSTAHRLLHALKSRGFVTQERPNSVYRPGSALLEIGLAAIDGLDIRKIARPVLQHLRDQSEETTSLLLLYGNTVRFIDCVESPRSVRVGSRTGIVLPAHCTAGGKALLAALPASDVDRRYQGDAIEARTPHSITGLDDLHAELEQIRERGYALNHEEGEDGVSAIGVAINDLIGYPLAALAIAVPTPRFEANGDGDKLVTLLMEARDAVHAALRESA